MKNIPAEIHSHLNDIERDVNNVRDREFKTANDKLDGKRKQNVENGLSEPTYHKDIITSDDFLHSVLHSQDNPIIVRYRVLYHLAIHSVTSGL